MHTWTPTLPESEGVRTPGPPQDRRHWFCVCVVWFADRKRAQKDKDEKLTDKQREEELALQQQQQQQKEMEKAAADAAPKEQQPFVMPADATLLQYISQSVEHIKPLPDVRQQASALAR